MPDGTTQYIAFPGVGSLAAGAFDAAMKSVWEFAGAFLTTSFGFIDKFTTPNLSPTTGPITTVMPAVLWAAGVIASLVIFVQIGVGAITRGTGLVKLMIGVGQYVLVTACGYAVLAAAVTAATGLTHGILKTGLSVDNWAGINGSNNGPFLAAVQSSTGVQLGMVAVCCVIPAAAGYLIEAMVRAAALLILAATLPILAAGLLSERTSSWFWKGLRWTIALLMLQPVTALVITVGFNIAAGAAGGAPGSGSAGETLGTLVIGGITLLISLLCPFALFKLLAFVDPSSPSGSAVRGAMSGGGMKSMAQGGGKASGSGQAAGEAATSGRFAAALGKAGPYGAAAAVALKAAHTVGQRTVGAADQVLSAGGVGHHGAHSSPVPGGSGGGGGAKSTGASSAKGPATPAGAPATPAAPSSPGASPTPSVRPGREPAPLAGRRPSPAARDNTRSPAPPAAPKPSDVPTFEEIL